MTTNHIRGILLATLLSLTSTFLFVNKAEAQPGQLDSSFGNNGLLIFQKESILNGKIVKVLPAVSGDYFVVYQTEFYDNTTYYQVVIVKYTKDGLIDSTYGSSGFSMEADVALTDAALQADGRIIVVGNTDYTRYYDPNFFSDIIVARFDVNGALDNSFSTDGVEFLRGTFFAYDYAKIITVKGDKIFIGGFFNTLVGGFGGFNIYVVNADGNNAQTIQVGPLRPPNFADPYNYAQAITIQGDKIIVAGFDDDSSSGTNFSIYRYYSNGAPDSTFGGTGYIITDIGSEDRGYTVATQNDKIVVAGSTFNFTTGYTNFAIARYNYDGSLDSSFNGTGKKIISFGGNAIAKSIVFKDGKIIVGGSLYNTTTGNDEFAIARLDSLGNLDTGFDTDGKQTTALNGGSLFFDDLFLNDNRIYTVGLGMLNNSPETIGLVAAYQLESYGTQNCPSDTVIFTDKGKCDAIVKNIDPVSGSVANTVPVNYTLTGATTGAGAGTASGKLFNKGTTIVTYVLANSSLNPCSFSVNVEDHEIPVIKKVDVKPDILWPPNHKMKDIDVSYHLSDNCGATAVITVSSNEPQSGTGNDDIPNDWQIIDEHHIRLRAERSNNGNGRIYTITITATDASGNKTSKKAFVKVPRGMSNQHSLKARAFPNPTTNYFTIVTETENERPLTIRVSDAFGRKVEVRTQVPPNRPVQIGANYSPGLYFAEIIQGANKVSLILIKLPGSSSGK